jgi:hypothetical protein
MAAGTCRQRGFASFSAGCTTSTGRGLSRRPPRPIGHRRSPRPRAAKLGHQPALELAELRPTLHEHAVDRRDPAAQVVRRQQLVAGAAEDGADRVPEAGADLDRGQDPPAVERVGDHAAEQRAGDLRDGAGQAEQADLERRVGQQVDLPGHRDGRQLAADSRKERPADEQPEVALSERRRESHGPASLPAPRAPTG